MKNQWIADGIQQKATHLIIMYDPEDKQEYPVFVRNANLRNLLAKLTLSEGKQKVVEVIVLDNASQ